MKKEGQREQSRIITRETELSDQEREQQLFGIIETGRFQDNIVELEEAIRSNELDTIADKLQGRQLEQMIIQKGVDGKFLDIAMNAVNAITQEQIGKNLLDITDPKDIQKILNAGISPFALAECCSIHYHKKNDTRVFQLGRILVEFKDSHPLMAAHAFNAIASTYARQDMILAAQQHNREAMTLLNGIPKEKQDTNTEWAKMKIQYGLLYDRAKQQFQPDMIDQFVTLAEKRRELGDDAHVGRSYLDAGRFAAQHGEQDRAVTYLNIAIEDLANNGYINALVQAYEALAKVRRENGEDGRAKRILWKGIGVGEKMKGLLKEDVERMKEAKESTLKIPATCLVELANDTFLVEEVTTDQDFPQFMGIAVDQEKKSGAEGIIRKKLEKILNSILQATAQEEGKKSKIALSARSSNIFIRDKGPKKAYFSYKSSFKKKQQGVETILASGIDKTPKDGYRVLSWQELLTYRDHFDERTQTLIDKEQEKRANQ